MHVPSVNTSERTAARVPPPTRLRTSPSRGASKAGFPIGVIFLVFFAIRACTSLTNSHTYEPSHYQAPTPIPKFEPKKMPLQVKDKIIVADPDNP